MDDATTYRILLRKAGKARIAIMVDSPYHMYDQTRFSTTEAEYKMLRNTKTPRRNGKVSTTRGDNRTGVLSVKKEYPDLTYATGSAFMAAITTTSQLIRIDSRTIRFHYRQNGLRKNF